MVYVKKEYAKEESAEEEPRRNQGQHRTVSKRQGKVGPKQKQRQYKREAMYIQSPYSPHYLEDAPEEDYYYEEDEYYEPP